MKYFVHILPYGKSKVYIKKQFRLISTYHTREREYLPYLMLEREGKINNSLVRVTRYLRYVSVLMYI